MEEFNLTEKREEACGYLDEAIVYSEKDVKEFIKREYILIEDLCLGKIKIEEFWEKRKELAGDKLI